jgi:hypothetical protein
MRIPVSNVWTSPHIKTTTAASQIESLDHTLSDI